MSIRRILALAAAASLALAACGSDSDDSAVDAGVGAGEDATEVSATIVDPADGAEVTNPVVVTAEASGIEIHPAADAVEGAGHFHVMVDTGCVAEGESIPKDDQHVHFGDGSTELDLGELEPGEHTLCLQVGDNDHVATAATDEITVTVGAGDGGDGTADGDDAAGATALFVDLADGDTVTSPLTVEAKATGIEIHPAADAVEGAGHFHVMVDTGCITEGESIPKDDQHLHFGDGSMTLEIGELAPGEHTLCLQVGDNDHVATAATHEVTVTVEA